MHIFVIIYLPHSMEITKTNDEYFINYFQYWLGKVTTFGASYNSFSGSFAFSESDEPEVTEFSSGSLDPGATSAFSNRDSFRDKTRKGIPVVYNARSVIPAFPSIRHGIRTLK